MIYGNIEIMSGDMLLSKYQTLTISVNTKSVMGAGLALKTKRKFPDVYVYYQDQCRSNKLTVKKPVLYKRQKSFDIEYSDSDNIIENPNHITWFLLFATKDHWRENSKLEYIVDGLEWIENNYKSLEIKSLALPALGCGLGNLSWEEVGPIMCKSLSKIDIPISIYLPNEREINQEYLSKKFLLG